MANIILPKSISTIQATIKRLAKSLPYTQGWYQKGSGVISGLAPNYFARLGDGTPAGNITIELYLNGQRIKRTKTTQNGSWKFDNLNPDLVYDIVARHPFLEGVISTKRQPNKKGITVYELPFNSSVDENSTHVWRRFVVKDFKLPLTIFYGTMFPIEHTIDDTTGLITLKITKQSTEETYPIRIIPFDETDYRDIDVVVPPN